MTGAPGKHHDQPATASAETALAGCWWLLRGQWQALVKTLKSWLVIRQARKNRVEQRISVPAIIGRQAFFLRRYGRYFRRFVLARETTIYER